MDEEHQNKTVKLIKSADGSEAVAQNHQANGVERRNADLE